MMRRRPTPIAVLAAAVVLAGMPSLSWASTITYQLTNTSAAGTAPVDQVIANVTPPGLIDQSNSVQGARLTVLTGSKGVDPSNLVVSVGDGTIPQGQPGAGNPYQLLLLTFKDSGFAPGGVLDFTLKLNQPNAAPPQLELPPSTTGLSLVQLTQSTGGSTPPPNDPTTTPAHNTPEPLSLILWSTIAGAGMIRARKVRLARMTRD